MKDGGNALRRNGADKYSDMEKALLRRQRKEEKKANQPWYHSKKQGGKWKNCRFKKCNAPHRELSYKGYCSENCMTQRQINDDSGFQFDLGHPVRSGWERKYADWLIRRGIRYEYEPKKFNLKYKKNGKLKYVGYVPDFRLPRQRRVPVETWVEVKGYMSEKDKLKIDLFKKTGRRLLIVDKDFFRSKYSKK